MSKNYKGGCFSVNVRFQTGIGCLGNSKRNGKQISNRFGMVRIFQFTGTFYKLQHILAIYQ